MFFDGKRTARRNSSNTVFYYFSDHLGTSREIVQAGQTRVIGILRLERQIEANKLVVPLDKLERLCPGANFFGDAAQLVIEDVTQTLVKINIQDSRDLPFPFVIYPFLFATDCVHAFLLIFHVKFTDSEFSTPLLTFATFSGVCEGGQLGIPGKPESSRPRINFYDSFPSAARLL